MDLQQFYMGTSFDAYDYFGAHLENGGVVFRTYAPNAQKISVVGDFNGWKEQPLEQIHQSGVWALFVPTAKAGQLYKYCIYGGNGRQEHCDPYGFGMELRPGACSVIRNLKDYCFHDAAWLRQRTRCYDRPLNIYELHLGSWKKNGADWYAYDEIAEPLIDYLTKRHYNYVEFMPLSEHPLDGSWGYQNTGFFAPTARYGTAAQLMSLVDQLHQAGIGAIMDFVPVHFAIDGYGLGKYDGTALYEYPHKDVGESEWGSFNFNHSRREVASFLQSAANYWLKEYHFDGLRIDAVSRLIYWQGDEKRGENGTTINFIKVLNHGIYELHPTAMLIAEDSTTYPCVTKDTEENGLGFDYKWNLSWMHDTLEYLSCHANNRPAMRGKFMFSLQYAYNERYILPLSHDEVVHGKKTIIDKLNGSYAEKFAQAKTLYLYMMTHPGKKLNFMGNELAMYRERDEARELDWDLLQYPAHDAFLRYMTELNSLYQKTDALWGEDDSRNGFQWVDCSSDPCAFSYIRKGKNSEALVILNFSGHDVMLVPQYASRAKHTLLLNTDWEKFGGSTKREEGNERVKRVSAFGGLILEMDVSPV